MKKEISFRRGCRTRSDIQFSRYQSRGRLSEERCWKLDRGWHRQGEDELVAGHDETREFKSGSTETSLSLNGNCRGLLIVSRAIRANLKIDEGKYSGSYVGAGTGTAGLSGNRKGNTINLGIRWAKQVNGDRRAQMSIQKVGDQGMRLTTVDTDPTTGKSVVTSQINLRRQ